MTSIQKDLVNSGIGLGERKIHFKLTLEQMKQLLKHVEALKSDETFLVQYCRKLRPVSDKSLTDDNAALGAYLKDLAKFVGGIKHASLKASVLFNCLAVAERNGEEYDKAMVMAYM